MAGDQGEGFEHYRKPTMRNAFLAAMEQIVPWQASCEVIEPHNLKRRPPTGLARVLRMYFLQHWFNLADEACGAALLASTALRRFVDQDFINQRARRGGEIDEVQRSKNRNTSKVRYRELANIDLALQNLMA